MGKVLVPHAPVTRDDSFYSTVQNRTSKLCIFPFYIFYFLGVDKRMPLLLGILNCNEEFKPT